MFDEVDPADEIQDVLTAGSLAFVEFDLRVALKARQLRLAQVVKKVADSVHLAHAIVARADVLMTLDEDDFPIGEVVDGVHVDKPYLLGAADLFTSEAE
ncbi:PIN domain-containing protein [Actinomycetospora termitidis]|uniref:PIN domain-containing protein n=1 Tax=Actinomycetospora termitidis TaxID=3053470 RepID=A0ABT7MHR0_9PSEU|nr:PIN domain-containing protein [Actinomycetospora sp. Odt1-22]MDL5160190.1 PIN domain-containing protein [Actinomycetospora sp. Odt1-22]